MEQTIALAALAFLVNKIIELAKYIRNKDVNGAVTLLAAQVAGVLVIFLASAAKVTHELVLPGLNATVGSFDAASKILVGCALASLGGTAYDFKKSFDNTDSAAQPPLVGGSPPAN